MKLTKINSESELPLTCSRSGTCCFGKAVMLNPWELLRLSKEKGVSSKIFRDLYTEFGGIRLHFKGTKDNKGQHACSQYLEGSGCSVHVGRPLACRLYPLGRQVQNEKVEYIFEGKEFPCLNDCSEVLNLPRLTVGEYLKGQAVKEFEKVQDAYLLVMQNIADIGFELLLETGLSESGDRQTLNLWRKVGNEPSDLLAERVGQEWLDLLMIPNIEDTTNEPLAFVQQHNELILVEAQRKFGNIVTLDELRIASVEMIGLALHLAKGLGADTKGISEHWVATAKEHGALE